MIFDGVGEYRIPEIQLTSYKECEFIPFNYAKGCKDKNGKGEFQEFNLYIKTDGTAPSESEDDSSTTEESTTKTINLIFGIGDQNVSERAIGTMIINNIELEAIDSTTFDEAKDKIENSGAISGSHDAIADYTGGSSDTEQDEDDDDVINEDLSGNNWYIYISVVLAVVIIIAVIAALVRYMAIKRKKSGDVSPTDKTTYDREITLLRQHNARNIDEVNEITEGYDAFDEDIEDHIEMMRALEEVEQLAEEMRAYEQSLAYNKAFPFGRGLI